MNSLSASAIFFFFSIFASSFLVQIGRAGNGKGGGNGKEEANLAPDADQDKQVGQQHPHEGLDNLPLMDMHFYGSIVLEMEDNCADPHFGMGHLSEKEKLCEVVTRLGQNLTGMNIELRQQQMAATSASEEHKKKMGTFLLGILKAIKQDVVDLSLKYHSVLGEMASEIRRIVNLIDRKDLIGEYKKTFDKFQTSYKQLMEEAKIGENSVTLSNAINKNAFKMNCIFQQIHDNHKNHAKALATKEVQGEEELREAVALAYKQFAINLFIHSLRLAHPPKSADGNVNGKDLKTIVESFLTKIEEQRTGAAAAESSSTA